MKALVVVVDLLLGAGGGGGGGEEGKRTFLAPSKLKVLLSAFFFGAFGARCIGLDMLLG